MNELDATPDRLWRRFESTKPSSRPDLDSVLWGRLHQDARCDIPLHTLSAVIKTSDAVTHRQSRSQV